MVDINPELLKTFGFWGSILVFKLLAMVPLTGRQRFGKQVCNKSASLSFLTYIAKMLT